MNYCPHCGGQVTTPAEWPFKCPHCGTLHFNSPKPVVAVLLHAHTPEGRGLVAIRRGIEPYKGTWAFPGGYIDHTEDWRKTAAREMWEELGVALDPKHFSVIVPPIVTPTNYLVLFVAYMGDVLHVEDFKLDPREVLEVRALTTKDRDTITLGVPSHQTFWEGLKWAD